MKLLWLASWYPNKVSPLDGDFIQRHAMAVSKFVDVSVIYVLQYGTAVPNPQPEIVESTFGSVKETRVYFSSFRTGIGFLDKLIYNWRYFRTYMSVIRSYLKKNGLPDLVHVHVPMKAGMMAQWIKTKWKVPYVVTEHAGLYVPGPVDAFMKRSLYFRRNVRAIFRKASAVTSVSYHNGRIIQRLFGLQHINIIHNVADTRIFYSAPTENDTVFRFIHVSTMGDNKNVIGILHTCAKLKSIREDWQIELVGPPNQSIIDIIQIHRLENFVSIGGAMSNQAVAARMQKASSLVMFSRVENFPCTIVEALCCGLTVVSSNVGGISEAVNASNGILVESENEEQLLDAMLTMIDHYHLFDRAAIAREAAFKYNYETIGKQFHDLYREVLPSFK